MKKDLTTLPTSPLLSGDKTPDPLPAPRIPYGYVWKVPVAKHDYYDATQMRAYAASVCASRDKAIQRLRSSNARHSIEMGLVEQLLEEGPDCDLTAMDMEYWTPVHDKLKAALEKK